MIVEAAFISHTISNALIIVVTFVFRRYALKTSDSQMICLSVFFFICGYESMTHIYQQMIAYFDLYTGPLVGAQRNTTIIINK